MRRGVCLKSEIYQWHLLPKRRLCFPFLRLLRCLRKEQHLHFTLPPFLPYLSETENGQFSFLFYHFNHHFLKWTSEKENSWLKTQAKFFLYFSCAYWISTLANKKGVVVLRLLGRVLELSSWISLEDPLSSNLLTPYRVIHQEGYTSQWLAKLDWPPCSSKEGSLLPPLHVIRKVRFFLTFPRIAVALNNSELLARVVKSYDSSTCA